MFAQLSTLTLTCRLPVSCCSLIAYQVEPLRLFHPVGDLRNISYLKTNKNDFNDAEAICEAISRPTMRDVSPKTGAQQDAL